MISIIVPFYNRQDMVMRRMLEFHQHFHTGTDQQKHIFLPEDVEILLMNNGSDPSKIEEGNIYYWQKLVNWFPVRYHKWEKNIGFGGVMNRGASKAAGEILIFFSDDVIVKGNFLPKILDLLGKDPTALIGGEVIWWPAGWNQFMIDDKEIVVPYANGWFLACRKETWEESGGFDPQYYPYDFEDVDLSTRWHEMGYNIVALNSQLISHIGGATISGFDPDRAAKTQQHRQLYIMKWYEKLPNLNTQLEKPRYDSNV
jgi:GT2 family glycosyltransferase